MGVVRKRILLLLCAVAVLFILGIAGWQFQEQRNSGLLYNQESSEYRQTVAKLLELRGEKLANLTSDYTYWDEMVDFVKTRDPKWAEINLVTGMHTFGADAIAVYNPSGVKVYSTDSFENASLLLPEFGPEQIKSLFSASPLCHFFLRNRGGLLEVRGAIIVPSADAKRTGPTYGYFLASQIWDSIYLDGVASLLDGKASLQPVSDGSQMTPGERKQSVIVFRKSLCGPDGRSIRILCVTKRFDEGDMQRMASRRSIILLGLFVGMMILVLAWGLSRFVARPLALISSAMDTQSPDTLSPLENDPSEFGRLATLIHTFFHQQVTLEEETRVRARAEKEIRKSKEKYKGLFESSRDAIMTLEPPSWLFTSCNPATVELFGAKDPEEFTSLGPWEVSPETQPDGRTSADKAKEMIETAMREGSHFFEWMHKRIGGEPFPATMLLTRMAQGGKTFLQATVRDITEQKRAEAALRESEEGLRSVLDTVDVGIAIIDAETHEIISVNPSACRMIGAASEQITNSVCHCFICPAEKGSCPITDRGQSVDRSERTLLTIGKVAVPILKTVTNITLNGRSCLLECFVDITERKRTEEALRENMDRLGRASRQNSLLLETMGEGIFGLDAQGRHTFVNQAAAQMLGYGVEELIGKDSHSTWHSARPDGSSYPLSECPIRATLANGTHCSGLIEFFTRKDGSGFFAEINSAPLIENGETAGAVVTFRDITERRRAEAALRESEEKYRVMFEGSAQGIMIADGKTKQIIYANPSVCRLLGYTEREMLQLGVADIHPKESLGHVASEFESQMRGEKALAPALPCLRKDGTVFYADVTATPIILEGGREYLVGFFADITERKRAEEAIALQTQAMNAAGDHIVILDDRGRIIFANRAFENQTGYGAEEALGKTPQFLEPQTRGAASFKALWEIVKSAGSWRGDVLLQSKDGSAYTAEIDITPVHDEGSRATHWIMIARNIVDRKAYEEKLDYQAHHDALTGLPNRLGFTRRLSELLSDRRGKNRVALMFLDLDRFKFVNDSLGHEVGDSVLAEAGQRLKSCVRGSDVVARIGGDEFTVILSRASSSDQVKQVASRILHALSRPFEVSGHRFTLGASIGISNYPDDAGNAETLLKNADAAMYEAKEAGGNTYRWRSQESREPSQNRDEIERELRFALERNEVEVHYQPIVELKAETPIGAEALLRWRYAEMGMISPAIFIPIAEESGLMPALGEYSLRAACSEAMRLQKNGWPSFEIAVNVSPLQLRDDGFVPGLRRILTETGLAPKCLNIELPWDCGVKVSDQEAAVIREVRDIGVMISVHNSGTKPPARACPKRLSATHVKIDGSLTKTVASDAKRLTAIRSATRLARGLGIKFTAQWIEDEEQLRTARELGCDYAQGFLISPPLSAKDLEAFLQAKRPAPRRRKKAA